MTHSSNENKPKHQLTSRNSGSCVHIQRPSLRRRWGRWWGRRRREVREGDRVWRPEMRGERRIEVRGRRRRGVQREVGWREKVRRWRVRAGRGEVHGRDMCVSRWWVCVSVWSGCVAERWVFIPGVLVPGWMSCVSWWETPDITLLVQGVLGNVGRIICTVIVLLLSGVFRFLLRFLFFLIITIIQSLLWWFLVVLPGCIRSLEQSELLCQDEACVLFDGRCVINSHTLRQPSAAYLLCRVKTQNIQRTGHWTKHLKHLANSHPVRGKDDTVISQRGRVFQRLDDNKLLYNTGDCSNRLQFCILW